MALDRGERSPLLARNGEVDEASMAGDLVEKGCVQDVEEPRKRSGWTIVYTDKDWWSLWLGLICLTVICLIVLVGKYDGDPPSPKRWTNRPLDAWESKNGNVRIAAFCVAIGSVLLMSTVAYTVIYATKSKDRRKSGSVRVYFVKFLASLMFISFLAGVAWWCAEQDEVHRYGMTFEVWGLALGMIVANTLPLCCGPSDSNWLMLAATGEDYIKVGLVLLGLDVQKIGQLLLPSLVTSWVVTPVVIFFSYGLVARRMIGLDVELPVEKQEMTASLAMMLVVGLAVCGSSAATAVHGSIPRHTAPNKDTELKLTITLLNLMTIVQMIAWPYFAWWVGVPTAVAGAWFGGSLDGTGNVVAAGAIFDELVDNGNGQIGDGNETNPIENAYAAVEIASTVKMVQNVLIGPVAIAVTIYWIAYVGAPDGLREANVSLCTRIGRWVLEIWMRFPKFVLGFIIASVVLTLIKMYADPEEGEQVERLVVAVRSWWFTIGFVAVGLGTHLPSLARQLRGGKSVLLYLVGQTFDLLLTFAAAWVAFTYIYTSTDLVDKE